MLGFGSSPLRGTIIHTSTKSATATSAPISSLHIGGLQVPRIVVLRTWIVAPTLIESWFILSIRTTPSADAAAPNRGPIASIAATAATNMTAHGGHVIDVSVHHRISISTIASWIVTPRTTRVTPSVVAWGTTPIIIAFLELIARPGGGSMAGTVVAAGIRSPHAVAAAAGVVADVGAAHRVHVIATS